MNEDTAHNLLASISEQRLVVLCGAGLSMAPPSSVPSARVLAQLSADRYFMATGNELPNHMSEDLEQQAEFFLPRPPLWASFRDQYIDWSRFRGNPNSGHFAIADFLGCRALNMAVSTNVDAMIEGASHRLGEPDFHPAVEGDEASHYREYSPLLKIHGCINRDRSKIIWCHGQVKGPHSDAEISGQLQIWSDFLKANLRGRDLVIVGFWTDWAYLNDVLGKVLQESEPALVYLVDTENCDNLKVKAPSLWALAEKSGGFSHIQQSGAEFLLELRILFGQLFFKRALAQSIPTYQEISEQDDQPEFVVPNDVNDLYDLRRDLCGIPSNRIVRDKQPNARMTMACAIHLLLQSQGARLEGSRYITDEDRRIRVVCGAGEVLHAVKARFSESEAQSLKTEIVICDAHTDGNVPQNIIREEPATIVRRGGHATWVTYDEARNLGYC
jgi:NAD-dependent SIR2 family protein deacetylase